MKRQAGGEGCGVACMVLSAIRKARHLGGGWVSNRNERQNNNNNFDNNFRVPGSTETETEESV